MGVVQFEHYSIVLLTTPANAPTFSEAERGRLQDAHLSYLSDLHDQGHLLACSPSGRSRIPTASCVASRS